MKIDIPLTKEGAPMMPGIDLDVISPKDLGVPLEDFKILAEFDKLVASEYEALADFLKSGKVLFIVNDVKRTTPTAEIIDHIDDYLKGKGQDFKSKQIDVIVATGSHSPPAEEGLRQILGAHYEFFKPRLMMHKAKVCEFEYIGDSDRGTPIKIDKQILGYDKILAINSVEPHYFAGYTGGRKSFLPGICHYETIEANHRMAMDERSKTLALDENPVNLDMIDVAAKIIEFLKTRNTEVLAINCVMNNGKIYSISAGDIFKCWEKLIPKANYLFTVNINGKFDVVIAETMLPYSKTLYQALKSFENGKLALRDGGILILDAECDEGLGNDNFYKVMTSAPTPAEIVDGVHKHYTLGAHKTTNLLAFLEKNKMYIVSELPDKVVKNCFCTPFKSVENALDAAIKELGMEKPRILRIKQANRLVPLVS